MSHTPTTNQPTQRADTDPLDVFAAARWFNDLWNSTARAVPAGEIEWQCQTWGSGRGGGSWVDTAVFTLVAEVFHLSSWRNHDGRDELVVAVPLDRFPEVARLIDRLGGDPESWPWLSEDHDEDYEQSPQIAAAAEFLGMSASAVAADDDLLDALRIE